MLPEGDASELVNLFPFLARLEVLPEWDRAAARFLERGGTVMVLGGPDTGKSTLCRYLVYRAYVAGLPGALVDLDLGQSHLGPPATLGLGLFPPRLPGEDGLFPEALYFIGQTSPVGATLEVAVGCRVLADEAARRGVTRVVVNTSGLVQGPAALRLNQAQAELLNPSIIFALQREKELEPLLRALGEKDIVFPGERIPPNPRGMDEGAKPESSPVGAGLPRPYGGPADNILSENTSPRPGGTLPTSDSGARPSQDPEINAAAHGRLIRLPLSSRVTLKPPEERRRYRESRFRGYFHQARRLNLPWGFLVWEGRPWGHGEPLSPAALGQFSRDLGVPALYGESQGDRVFLLVEDAPGVHGPSAPEAPPEGAAVRRISWQSLKWRLVGLLDAHRRTLALAIILPAPWPPDALPLWTPLPPEAAIRVRFIKAGKMQLNLEGREISHV